MVLVYANRSRSPRIAAAADLLVASWFVSLVVWRWVPSEFRALGFAFIDFAMAAAFFFLSRRRWFPVPLFFLHGALAVYDTYALLIGTGPVWVVAFANRAFELALAYILSCSLFRISKLGENEKGAP